MSVQRDRRLVAARAAEASAGWYHGTVCMVCRDEARAALEAAPGGRGTGFDGAIWRDAAAAADRLTYARARGQLDGLVRADRNGTLKTWPLVIVRHANAGSRSSWTQADPLRPLDASGRERAQALVPLLKSYGVTRVVTSPSVRCLDTVLPYAVTEELKIRLKPGLSEESFAQRPDHAPRHLTKLLARGSATVMSTHGPVLPVLPERPAEGGATGGGRVGSGACVPGG